MQRWVLGGKRFILSHLLWWYLQIGAGAWNVCGVSCFLEFAGWQLGTYSLSMQRQYI